MEKAGRLTAEVLHILASSSKPGVSTLDLDHIATKEMKKRKIESVFINYQPKFASSPYPANICTSVNDTIVHGIPNKNKILTEGDIISIDIATKCDNFIGDTATTVGVGNISSELKKFLAISEQSMWEGIIKSVIGNRTGDIGFAIQSYLDFHQLYVVKEFYGHGVGRSLHEEPSVPHFGTPENGLLLEEGLTFTIEPMICMNSDKTKKTSDGWGIVSSDGMPAAHFEHTIAITKNGPIILTKL